VNCLAEADLPRMVPEVGDKGLLPRRARSSGAAQQAAPPALQGLEEEGRRAQDVQDIPGRPQGPQAGPGGDPSPREVALGREAAAQRHHQVAGHRKGGGPEGRPAQGKEVKSQTEGWKALDDGGRRRGGRPAGRFPLRLNWPAFVTCSSDRHAGQSIPLDFERAPNLRGKGASAHDWRGMGYG